MSPFLQTASVSPPLQTPVLRPLPTVEGPAPLQLERLVREDRAATDQTRSSAPAQTAARPAITIEPDRNTADFVPTPEPPPPTLEALRAVAAQHLHQADR